MFADDTLVYYSTKRILQSVHNINADLDLLYNVINQNKLKLNIDKTKMIIITNNNNINKNEIDIKINSEKLNIEKEIKHLGIIIDDKLNFNANIDYMAKKWDAK